jgi:hypothetical protein
MDEMDEKQITFGQLLQVTCPRRKDFPREGDKMVTPNMFWGKRGTTSLKEGD